MSLVFIYLIASIAGVRFQSCSNQNIESTPDDGNIVSVDSVGGSDDTNNGITSPLKTIEQVKKCYGQNTTMTLAGGRYELTPPANLSRLDDIPDTDGNPYFNVVGQSQSETIIEVTGDDYQKMHIVGSITDSEVLYVFKATFTIKSLTVQVSSASDNRADASLAWVHENTSVVLLQNISFNATTDYPKHLFVHTGGKLSLETVIISQPASGGKLNSSVLYWFATTSDTSHNGSWEIAGVTIKDVNYIHDKSLFEQDNFGTLNVSITNSVFDNIIWRLDGTVSSFHRLNNDDEQRGLVYTAPASNHGTVSIANSTFKALDCSTHVPVSQKTAPVVILSSGNGSAVTTTALSLPNLTFENCSGTAGGTLVTKVNVNLIGLYSTGNKQKTENGSMVSSDAVEPIGNVVINYDNTSCTGNRDDGYRTCGEAEPDNFPAWVLVVIIVVVVVVVAAVVVIIVTAVYYRKKKYQTLADEEEYIESSSSSGSSSLRSSEKDNEMDSI